MRLKDTFVMQELDGEQLLVETGGAFPGFVRSNATAAFIVNRLKAETSREAILDAMCREFDAPREVMAADVDTVLAKLRSIGALTGESGVAPC